MPTACTLDPSAHVLATSKAICGCAKDIVDPSNSDDKEPPRTALANGDARRRAIKKKAAQPGLDPQPRNPTEAIQKTIGKRLSTESRIPH